TQSLQATIEKASPAIAGLLETREAQLAETLTARTGDLQARFERTQGRLGAIVEGTGRDVSEQVDARIETLRDTFDQARTAIA
ncbi:hypothetical protein ABTE31_20890, partial [Acinetobacter baumannii]